ncbi:SARP family transcriptional regulator [Streptosporangium violaceochromogenes]|nr:SARP family transcriptional regulator [Streptosporangium violaceochromogenes]
MLAAGETGLTAEALAVAVWGDLHDRAGSVKSCLAEMRRLLPGRVPLGTSGGYRVRLAGGDVLDLEEFRKLAADGMVLARSGDREAAALLLRQALELWGDPPLEDLPGGVPPLHNIRASLLSERATALAMFFRLEMEFGRHHAILSGLRKEAEREPLAEEWHELLMRSLYLGGRRGEALRHYTDVADTLRRETGHPPGKALRQAYAEISADTQGAAPPRPGRVVLPRPAQLPPDITDFVGRRQETQHLTRLLTPRPDTTATPVVLVSGMGGLGKTALAVHAAHLLRPLYPGGQLFVSLSRTATVGEVLAELLTSLGVPAAELPPTASARSAVLRTILAGRRMLIVIDNAETLHQAQPFLPGAAGCGVIITSRVMLHGPGVRHVQLTHLDGGEALTLLEEIVGADRVSRESGAAGEVLEACGGLPLAVRVAGARLLAQPHWPLRLLADRLTELEGGGLAVAASIGESYDALDDGARRAFRVLALAGPGDWPMWLAEMLLGAGQGDAALETLTTHSLLSPAGADRLGHPRYRQHDLVRDYAAARLAERRGERDQGVARLLLGWLVLADRACAQIPGEPAFPPPARLPSTLHAPPRALELIDADPGGWLARECTQLLEVVRLACADRRFRQGYGIAMRLSPHLYRAGRVRDAHDMWRTVMRAAAAADVRLAAEARHRVAALTARGPDGPARALPMLDTCVEVFAELVDRQPWARSLALRAWCLAESGEAGRAEEDARRAVELAGLAGDRHVELVCLRTLGVVASARGRHAEAVAAAGAAVEIGRTITGRGDAAYEAFAAAGLAGVLVAAGQAGRALAVCEAALPLARRVGHPVTQASLAERAGDALMLLGREQEAAAWFGEAVALCGTDGAVPHRAARYAAKLRTATGGPV